MTQEVWTSKEGTTHTQQKALEVNLDLTTYGTFAEIGAGQEVARWLFRVGGAAGTIAKSISAYDMTVSDAIYGPSERYVSRDRLRTMLDYEFNLLRERLDAKRGVTTRFFAFANTVKARSYVNQEEGHGWLGIKFQVQPRAEPSQIIIHVRMLDRENVQQQEALGILGVNLLYAALYCHDEPERVIDHLADGLTRERVDIDMIKFSGPDFTTVDNRLMSVRLIQRGLADAAMFTAAGEVVQAGEALYKKSILVERGSFRPVTHATLDMLRCAQAQFIQEPGVESGELVVIMEMTLRNLVTNDGLDPKDFLDRVDILGTLGKTVLISNYGRYYRLAGYLFRYTRKKVGLVLGIPSLRELFEEKYYDDLDGGILESFGRLFKNELKLYAYPSRDPATGAVITAGNLRIAPHLQHLYSYLVENQSIQPIRDFNPDYLPISSAQVLSMIQAGDTRWQECVPAEVARMIRERRLLGCASM